MSEALLGSEPHILQAFDLIDKLADETPQVSEALFVSKYLPIFASKGTDIDLSPWLDVCKSAMLPVDVVANGQVIFRVPAMVRTIPTTKNALGQMPLSEVLANAKLKGDVYPPAGDAYLDAHVGSRVTNVPANMEDLVAWNNIFTRYGYDPIVIPGKTLTGGEIETPESNVFTGEYEDV